MLPVTFACIYTCCCGVSCLVGFAGVLIGREGNRGVDGNRGITICFSCVEDDGLCPVKEWDDPLRASSRPSST